MLFVRIIRAIVEVIFRRVKIWHRVTAAIWIFVISNRRNTLIEKFCSFYYLLFVIIAQLKFADLLLLIIDNFSIETKRLLINQIISYLLYAKCAFYFLPTFNKGSSYSKQESDQHTLQLTPHSFLYPPKYLGAPSLNTKCRAYLT